MSKDKNVSENTEREQVFRDEFQVDLSGAMEEPVEQRVGNEINQRQDYVEGGVLWLCPENRPIAGEMSADEIGERFKGYAYSLHHNTSKEVWAAFPNNSDEVLTLLRQFVEANGESILDFTSVPNLIDINLGNAKLPSSS